jgi:transposase
MEIIGLDLHKRESQLCRRSPEGRIRDERIPTTRARFTAALGGQAPARILLEASTESEWVAAHLEQLGHTVIVADPNFAPMYATLTRRIKTDRRDAHALMEACALGAYRPTHRLSAARRHLRAELVVRDTLVHTRTRAIVVIKTLVRRDGLRVPSGASRTMGARVAALDLATQAPTLATELAPLLALLPSLTAAIAAADGRLAVLAAGDPVIARLATAPSVGVVTAAGVVAVLDDTTRFPSAHAVEAYLGLVPREDSSAERRHRGAITKAGNTRARWLLVEAGWRILRSKAPAAAPLRAWGQAIAARRGRRIAAVAIARRLAGILYAMWRDGTDYDSAQLRGPRRRPASPVRA